MKEAPYSYQIQRCINGWLVKAGRYVDGSEEHIAETLGDALKIVETIEGKSKAGWPSRTSLPPEQSNQQT